MVSLETALQFAGFFAEAVIIGLLLFRHIPKKIPIFFLYIVWSFVSDVGFFVLSHRYPDSALRIYLDDTILDSIVMFCVLIEVSMSVLKPVRTLLPRWVMLAIAILVGLCSFAVWHFIRFQGWEVLDRNWQILTHLEITSSAMRILFFLILASLGQLLSLGWRDRELQIATGFGIYALGSLSVSLLHVNQGLGTADLSQKYHMVDAFGAAAYFCTLCYWAVCFAQDVPERRQFTPQMENFLLAVAGNVRATRMAMTDTSKKESDRRNGR